MTDPNTASAPKPGALRQARLHVPARILTATLGNYVLSAMATAWLARMLALVMHPAEASALATVLSFALFAALVIVIFAARKFGSLCLTLALAGAVLALLLWLGLPGAGGGV